MSVTPTGSQSLVQIKPEKIEASPTSSPTPAEQDSSVVNPTQPVAPIGQITQESETATTLFVAPKTPEEEQEQDLETNKAVEKLNSVMATMKRDLEFEFDQDLDRTIVTVRDSTTQEVVRKLPSEAAIKLAKVLQDTQTDQTGPIGQLLDVKT